MGSGRSRYRTEERRGGGGGGIARFLSAEDVASRYKLKVLTAVRRSLIRRVTIRAVPRNSRGLFPQSSSWDSKSPELKLYISVETLVRSPPPPPPT